ncbi:MAG: hypothetical protein M3Y33_11780, partial [Actinomycetota bacterium]|nr:hypothetical protein [Actinomycetota bacterium]
MRRHDVTEIAGDSALAWAACHASRRARSAVLMMAAHSAGTDAALAARSRAGSAVAGSAYSSSRSGIRTGSRPCASRAISRAWQSHAALRGRCGRCPLP